MDKLENQNKKTVKFDCIYIILSIIILGILSCVVLYYICEYPSKDAPEYEINQDSIIVKINQDDSIFRKTSEIKYRIREINSNYTEWQNSKIFQNLSENEYYIQTCLVDGENQYIISNETKAKMYKGELEIVNNIEAATEKGGLYKIPYYEYIDSYTKTSKCPKTGLYAGLWGDANLKKCSFCGEWCDVTRTNKTRKVEIWDGRLADKEECIYDEHTYTRIKTEYHYSYTHEEEYGSLNKIYYIKE